MKKIIILLCFFALFCFTSVSYSQEESQQSCNDVSKSKGEGSIKEKVHEAKDYIKEKAHDAKNYLKEKLD